MLKEAIKINNMAQKYDGVEEIKDDGTEVFTEQAQKQLREMIGYSCLPFKPRESLERAKELGTKLKAFGEKQGIWSG
jgi:hypothetical protein